MRLVYALCAFISVLSWFLLNLPVSFIWLIPVFFLGFLLVFHAVFWIYLLVITVPVNMNKPQEKYSKFYYFHLNVGYRYLCRMARCRIHVSGLEKVPVDRRFLLVSNHRSRFDNMFQAYILGSNHIAYISKPENFKIPLARKLMKKSGYLAIDRTNPKNAVGTIVKAIDYIQSGEISVGIFPEGTRSKDGKMGEMHAGSFKIATKAQCPIVVVTLRGTENIHKNAPWIPTDVYMDVLDVIEPGDRRTTEICDQCSEMMNSFLLENDRYAS